MLSQNGYKMVTVNSQTAIFVTNKEILTNLIIFVESPIKNR